MSEAASEASGGCPSDEIGAYLDAELSPTRSDALEMHFASCSVCRDELNSQKAFLLELSRTLETDAAIELPKDFAKVVVTRAESSVSGLRKRSERIAAIGIVALLAGLAVAGFAGDWGRVPMEAARPVGAAGTLMNALGELVYNIGFAFSFMAKRVFSGMAGFFSFVATVALAFAAAMFFLRRHRRAAG